MKNKFKKTIVLVTALIATLMISTTVNAAVPPDRTPSTECTGNQLLEADNSCISTSNAGTDSQTLSYTADVSGTSDDISISNGNTITIDDDFEADTNANTQCSNSNSIYLDGAGNCQDLSTNTDSYINGDLITSNSIDGGEIDESSLDCSSITGGGGLCDGNDADHHDDPGDHAATSTVDISDEHITNVREIEMQDWDDDGGGSDNSVRLLRRDDNWMFYNGGFVIGSYSNNALGDIGDGNLLTEGDINIAGGNLYDGTGTSNFFEVSCSDDQTITNINSAGSATCTSIDNVDRLDGLHAGSFIRSNSNDNVNAHTEWQDGQQIRLGTNADFRMWNNNGHTYMRSYRHGNQWRLQGEDAGGTNEPMIYTDPDSWVRLYYNGALKAETTGYGLNINVDDSSDNDGLRLDGNTAITADPSDNWLRLNNNNDFTNGIYTPGFIRADGGAEFRGNLNMRGNNINNVGTLGDVDSTAHVNNLNADLLDGNHASTFCQSDGTNCPNYDNYNDWDLIVDGSHQDHITSNEDVGFDGGSGINLNWDGSRDITITHADTSTAASPTNSGGQVIQTFGMDTYGHVTSTSSTDLDNRYIQNQTDLYDQACGTGWVDMGSYCIEKADDGSGTQTWWGAAQRCRDRGGRLCTYSEWYAACNADVINDKFDNWEMTTEITDATNSEVLMADGGSGCAVISNRGMSSGASYRCCK